MNTTQFVALAAISLANTAATIYFAYTAKRTKDAVESEVADQKEKANELRENIIASLRNLTF